MARDFSPEQIELLRFPGISQRLLTTWYLDDGDHYFCNDAEDLVYGATTFIGASALASATDVKSGTGMAAEGITITVDGTRLNQVGFTDPAELFRGILEYDLHNRRVDFALGYSYPDQQQIQLVVELFSGKINYAKVVDERTSFSGGGLDPIGSKLEIYLDSLAMRYSWVTARTRSHQDQLEIDPADMFFSFVQNNLANETSLYWGKENPNAPSKAITLFGRLFG